MSDNLEKNIESNYEKKTYKLFLFLLMGFILVGNICVKYSKNMGFSEFRIVKLSLLFCLIFLFATGYIVYKKKRLYWLTTYSYDDVLNMKPEEREYKAIRVWKVFRLFLIIGIVYFLVGFIFNIFNIWLDMGIFTLLLILMAIKV